MTRFLAVYTYDSVWEGIIDHNNEGFRDSGQIILSDDLLHNMIDVGTSPHISFFFL